MSDVARVASWLRGARAVVVITGAGISAESGVPTFRGADGLWRSFRPEDLATPQAFARDPGLVWDWYRWRRRSIANAAPNPGHEVLARWDSPFPDYLLVTQNVDGLHTRAGNRRLVEVARAVGPALPTCSSCGAILRPDVVWFGEALDGNAVDSALAAIHGCDVLLLAGTLPVIEAAL